ncbi:MAG TPA: DUF998 domain-containing protein [Streptosporangiaceae bacterium]|nr:DUF998 domain-containing protein [Streptosporangiaceae bacterium]
MLTDRACAGRQANGQPIAADLTMSGQTKLAQGKRTIGWILGIGGLLAYNWWVLVPFKPGLLRSPDEFFSNLEVTGQPYATVMQHLDVLSGLLILAAFAVTGFLSISNGRREWLGMVAFAISGLIGGLFPQVCEDGVSITCMDAERHFQLPLSQYVHDGAGIIEYVGITLALLLAVRRTRSQHTATARTYRALAIGAAIMYPILGLTYMINKLGAVVEGTFFVGFAVMVVVQLHERLTQRRLSADHNEGMIDRWESRPPTPRPASPRL